MDDAILWEIQNQCLNTLITEDWKFNSEPYFLWKGIHIFPSYPVLKAFVHLFVEPLKPLLHNVGNNISFLKINNCIFAISCDWCSIVNGVLETVRVNLNKNPELLDQVDFKTLNVCLCFIYDWIPNYVIDKRHKKLFGYITNANNSERLRLITKFYVYAEYTEAKWCPFKRFQNRV